MREGAILRDSADLAEENDWRDEVFLGLNIRDGC